MGGREVSRPYRVWFFAESERFFMFLFLYPQYFSTTPLPQFKSSEVGKFTSANVGGDGTIGDLAHSRRLLITFSVIYKI